MISTIVAVVVFGLVISVVIAYALEPGPTPTDIAVAYENAWDRLDFGTLWTLSGSELRDGLDQRAYIAAKGLAYSGRAEASRSGCPRRGRGFHRRDRAHGRADERDCLRRRRASAKRHRADEAVRVVGRHWVSAGAEPATNCVSVTASADCCSRAAKVDGSARRRQSCASTASGWSTGQHVCWQRCVTQSSRWARVRGGTGDVGARDARRIGPIVRVGRGRRRLGRARREASLRRTRGGPAHDRSAVPRVAA